MTSNKNNFGKRKSYYREKKMTWLTMRKENVLKE